MPPIREKKSAIMTTPSKPWNLADIATTVEAEIRRMANVAATDSEFTRDVHIFDYGYVDSFGAVDLVSFCEKTFGISVPDADLANIPMNTVNEIAGYVFKRVSSS